MRVVLDVKDVLSPESSSNSAHPYRSQTLQVPNDTPEHLSTIQAVPNASDRPAAVFQVANPC